MADKFVGADGVGTDDDAAGRGDTSGDPYATIDHALRLARTNAIGAGDTCTLLAGTHTLTARVNIYAAIMGQGTAGNHVNVVGEAGETVTVDVNSAATTGIRTDGAAGAQYFHFQDFTLMQATTTGMEIGGPGQKLTDVTIHSIGWDGSKYTGWAVISSGASPIYTNCTAYNCKNGLDHNTGASPTFTNCVAYQCRHDGFAIANSTTGTSTLTGCTAYECGDACMDLSGAVDVTDCTVHTADAQLPTFDGGSEGTGIKCWDSRESEPAGRITLLRCLVYGCRNEGITPWVRNTATDDCYVTIDNCTIADTKIGIHGGTSHATKLSYVTVRNTISSHCGLNFQVGSERRGMKIDNGDSVLEVEHNNLWHHDPSDDHDIVIDFEDVDYDAADVNDDTWGAAATTAGVDEADSIAFDPAYTDLGGEDFTLGPGSPCIDAGLDIGEAFFGAAPDMGYAESGSADPGTGGVLKIWTGSAWALFPGGGGIGSSPVVTANAALAVDVIPVGADGARAIKNSTGVAVVSGTGALQLPAGTTAQRPTAVDGRIRYNSDTPGIEGVTASAWGAIGGGGAGDVVGPAGATDNMLARYDGATGKLLQISTLIVTDAGTISGINQLHLIGDIFHDTHNVRVLRLSSNAGADTEFSLGNAVAPTSPLMQVVSAAANANFRIQAKGTGTIELEDPTNVTGALAVTGVSKLKNQLMAGGVTTTSLTVDLSTGLIAQWTMNDNAANTTVVDSTTNHDGTFIDPGGDPNTDAHSVAGKISTALTLDGSDDYISVADHADLDSDAAYSVACWFMLDAAFQIGSGASRDFFNKRQNGGAFPGWFFGLFTTADVSGVAGLLLSHDTGPGSDSIFFDPGTIAAGEWHHYVATWDGATTGKLYIDGRLVKTDTGLTNGAGLNNATLKLGTNHNLARHLAADMDDSRYYSLALSLNQVLALYNSGNGTESTSATFTLVRDAHTFSDTATDGGSEAATKDDILVAGKGEFVGTVYAADYVTRSSKFIGDGALEMLRQIKHVPGSEETRDVFEHLSPEKPDFATKTGEVNTGWAKPDHATLPNGVRAEGGGSLERLVQVQQAAILELETRLAALEQP